MKIQNLTPNYFYLERISKDWYMMKEIHSENYIIWIIINYLNAEYSIYVCLTDFNQTINNMIELKTKKHWHFNDIENGNIIITDMDNNRNLDDIKNLILELNRN